MTTLCLMPTVLASVPAQTLLPTFQQERFFFDLFGIVCACWLVCWVTALNDWPTVARAAQWLGIIILSIDEAILLSVWNEAFLHPPQNLVVWLAPLLVQTYLMGCFFAFFTLPALTASGNRRLTGLGTLVLILPWLLGHDYIIAGSELLRGLSSIG